MSFRSFVISNSANLGFSNNNLVITNELKTIKYFLIQVKPLKLQGFS
ncbi:hypothetical protein [Clostridium diolis]